MSSLATEKLNTQQIQQKPQQKAEEWNNFKDLNSGMTTYGEPRLELAKYVRDEIFAKIGKDIPHFIESGTLLGAHRNNKYIPHDDDFDYAILFEQRDSFTLLEDFYKKIKSVLPEKYDARIINTYTQKIEVFCPEYGKYFLKSPLYNGADYHHVTIDIQTYEYDSEQQHYETTYRLNASGCNYQKEDIFPLSKILLEGELFNAPKNCVQILEAMYGSIDPRAKFSIKTGKYHLQEEDIIKQNP